MLESENLRLRALKVEDLKFLNEWRNDLENKIMAQGHRLPVSLIQDENWLNSKMGNTHSSEVFFMLETHEGKSPIGLIQLNNIDYVSGTAIWGFIIGDKAMRGKGYSREAALLLFDFAFNVLNLRKIIGYTIAFNEATFNMLKNIGVIHMEGRLKKHYYVNGKYHDVLISSVFRDDYPKLYPKH